jgi:nucleoside-diphosphate-sugar epimerase
VDVFVTGGTGYIGRALAPLLLARGHRVRVLTRAESVPRVPAGAQAVIGNALDAASFSTALTPRDTVVHLVGTPHPSPAKAAEFRRVDLPSIEASVAAATAARIAHLVYVSVAHPAPVMRAYIAVRSAGEDAIARAGLTATVLRPWYVLGPGHRWPMMLLPLYACLEALPATRAGAQRLGLLNIQHMVDALVHAIETPPAAGSRRVLAVPDIRRLSGGANSAVAHARL